MGHEPIDDFDEHGTRDRRDATEPVPDESGVVMPQPEREDDLSAGDPDAANESDGSGEPE